MTDIKQCIIEVAKEIEGSGETSEDGRELYVKLLEKDDDFGGWKCCLTDKLGKKNYSHSRPGQNKRDAICMALEHLMMMGRFSSYISRDDFEKAKKKGKK